MPRLMKWFAFVLLSSALLGTVAQAATTTLTACDTATVQQAINRAAAGDTIRLPALTCHWNSGVTIAGKGLTLQGAGSGRIVAYGDLDTLTLGNGIKTLTVFPTKVGATLSFGAGDTVRISELGVRTNFMQGSVVSFNGTTLTVNVTSSDGGCGAVSSPLSNCSRWLISIPPATVIVNDSSSNAALFTINEDTSIHTSIGGIKVAAGTGRGTAYDVFFVTGGKAVLLHDLWIEVNANGTPPPNGTSNAIFMDTNRGVIWNLSCDDSPITNFPIDGCITVQDRSNLTNSWTTRSAFGTNDVTGEGNVYVESSDFHALAIGTSTEDNGRMVARYNLYNNNAMIGTHGADTSFFGQRYFELYNNVGVFSRSPTDDCTTFNMNSWGLIRGGTFAIHHNTIPAIQSQCYGTKGSFTLMVMNLQRNAGPDPCYAQDSSGGARYPSPRQVGFGNVTGTGRDGFGRTTDPNPGVGWPGVYVGDSEPGYIWANSSVPLPFVADQDYGSNDCTAGHTVDSTDNYVVLNRDYFNGATAKPGYTPYQYPHPLTHGPTFGPPPPSNLRAVVR